MLLTHLQTTDDSGFEYLVNTVNKEHRIWFLRQHQWEDSSMVGFNWMEIPQTLTVTQEKFDKCIIIKRYSMIEPFIEEYFEDVL